MKRRRASMAPPHRIRRALTALAVLAALGGCGGNSGVQPGDALFQDAGEGDGLVGVHINEPILLGLEVLRANPGTHLVHLLEADMVGAPPGLVIDHVWAESRSQGGGISGMARGVESLRLARANLHDVSQVTLDPMCGPAAKCTPNNSGLPPATDWYLVVQAHISRLGSYTARGLRFEYEVDGQKYDQTLNYRIGLSSGGDGSLPKL